MPKKWYMRMLRDIAQEGWIAYPDEDYIEWCLGIIEFNEPAYEAGFERRSR